MSKDLLILISEKIQKKSSIDEDFIKFLEELFPNGSKKILEVLKRRITKYIYTPSNRVIWTVMGHEKEHLIYPKLYCSCIDFYKEVVLNRHKPYCKHIIAQAISEALNDYDEVMLQDNEIKNRIEDLKLKP